ncbi:CRISPR-associated protein Cas4 [Thermaerobacter litoralis]
MVKGSEEPESPVPLGGTLIWYYTICRRQAWLMAHAVLPDEDDPNLVYGRFLHQWHRTSHPSTKTQREVLIAGNRLDVVVHEGGRVVVVEVKKSDRFRESARLQLAHYLLTLEELGIQAEGELHFPEQRRRERVVLDDGLRRRVREVRHGLQELLTQSSPPQAKRISWCRRCAYAEYCWA